MFSNNHQLNPSVNGFCSFYRSEKWFGELKSFALDPKDANLQAESNQIPAQPNSSPSLPPLSLSFLLPSSFFLGSPLSQLPPLSLHLITF